MAQATSNTVQYGRVPLNLSRALGSGGLTMDKPYIPPKTGNQAGAITLPAKTTPSSYVPTATAGTPSPYAQPNNQTTAGIPGLINPTLDTLRRGLEGVQGGLANMAKPPFSPSNPGIYGNITSALADRSNQPNDVYTQGIKDYGSLSQKIADIGMQGARGRAGYLTTGTTPVAEGNAAVVAQTTAAQQQALAEQQRAALTSAGLGQAQQGLEQSALASAGGLAKPEQLSSGNIYMNPVSREPIAGGPSQVSPGNILINPLTGQGMAGGPTQLPYGTQYINPLTGQPVNGGGGNLDPQIVAMNLAKDVANGTKTYEQAVSSLGYSGNAGQEFLNQALQKVAPGLNLPQMSAQIGAQQTATGIAGTAVPQANQSIYASSLNDYYQMNSMLRNVEDLGNLVVSVGQAGNINPLAPQFANQTIATFRNQLSSPDQAQFNSALATFQNAAQALLAQSDGSTPTGVQAAVKGIANGSLQLGALKALVEQAQREGKIKLSNQASIVNQARSGTLGGTQTGGGPATAGGMKFQQDASGNWM